MHTELFNIVRSHKGNKTIIHERVSKSFVNDRLPELKRRARDNHSGVYFDAVIVPDEVIKNVGAHINSPEQSK
jgi:predicted nucleotidyltransferase